MFQHGTWPDTKTYSTLIKSAANANDPYKCLVFLENIISEGGKTNLATLNSLIQTCLSSEDPNVQNSTDMIVKLMSQWKIGPNGTTFIILLRHCKSHDRLDYIWRKMLKYGLRNNGKLQEEIIKICYTKLSENGQNAKDRISKCFD
jgi:hypothetical protein